MLNQTIISISLFLIFVLECARLYLGIQGNIKEKVKYRIFILYINICRDINNIVSIRYIDSRFGSILDVFVDPPIAFAAIIFVSKYYASRNRCSRRHVHLASVTTRFRVCGPPRYGKTSQASVSRVTILQQSAQQNRIMR